MTRPPSHPPCAAPGIVAVIGDMLCVLLAALLGVAGARPRAVALPGVMVGVLRAAAEADMAMEPEVEWVAVPAPWRAGQGWGAKCARPRKLARPFLGARGRGRGPPARLAMSGGLITGMA